jgi:hypothetical protein
MYRQLCRVCHWPSYLGCLIDSSYPPPGSNHYKLGDFSNLVWTRWQQFHFSLYNIFWWSTLFFPFKSIFWRQGVGSSHNSACLLTFLDRSFIISVFVLRLVSLWCIIIQPNTPQLTAMLMAYGSFVSQTVNASNATMAGTSKVDGCCSLCLLELEWEAHGSTS